MGKVSRKIKRRWRMNDFGMRGGASLKEYVRGIRDGWLHDRAHFHVTIPSEREQMALDWLKNKGNVTHG